jgi:hypothetical protein
MSETLTTTPCEIAPSSSEEAQESPSRIVLSQRHQQNLKELDEMTAKAAEEAIRPFLERRNGYLAAVMTALELTGNWDYDAQTFTFTRK